MNITKLNKICKESNRYIVYKNGYVNGFICESKLSPTLYVNNTDEVNVNDR